MKSFKHLRKLSGYSCSRKALRHYSLYRSCALSGSTSLSDLIEFHVYESSGQLPVGCDNFAAFCKKNGFANGKWVLKITQDQIIDDLKKGFFCKADFYSRKKIRELFGHLSSEFTYSRSSWFWDKALVSIIPGNFYNQQF